ncbi:hypothetical protein KIL84_021965 [Mauremys mutica]|uniref:Uncharacterized protein n=1 Tax=Mauremys mutica TaxID=74926 RepID=A0A9D4AWV0_9SAUR|nr:hypothetical protein KIL84_021965 [Mauremys mutica]
MFYSVSLSRSLSCVRGVYSDCDVEEQKTCKEIRLKTAGWERQGEGAWPGASQQGQDFHLQKQEDTPL